MTKEKIVLKENNVLLKITFKFNLKWLCHCNKIKPNN